MVRRRVRPSRLLGRPLTLAPVACTYGVFPRLWSLGFRTVFEIITEQQILVAQVEFAPGDDGVGPAILLGSVRLVEAAMFFVAVGRGFDQGDGSLVFGTQIETAISIDERAFAELVFFLPFGFAALK